MRTCLLISGLPRSVEACHKNIMDNIITPNNPDIFIHTWGDEAELLGHISALYNPVSIKVEKQRIFKNTHNDLDRMMVSHGRSYKREMFVEMVYSSWYSIQQANLLKEHYRLENDVVYDYVIRARFDITYSKVVRCADYDRNVLNISNKGLPPDMIDDRFAFGSNSLMNVYASGFNLLDHVNDIRATKDGIYCGETLVFEMARIFGLGHRQITDLHCGHVR